MGFRHILVVGPRGYGYPRDIMEGIGEYVFQRQHWLVTFLDRAENFTGLTADGLIVFLLPWYVNRIRQFDAPVVNVSNHMAESPYPKVAVDDQAVGRLGAKFFLDQGYQHFAFCGFAAHGYSQKRQTGFEAELAAAGRSYQYLPILTMETEIIQHWLASQPKPLALMACNDRMARRIAQECQLAGFGVPRDVAILGVDNEADVCTQVKPALSSIALDGRRVGRESLLLLERMFLGQAPPQDSVTVAPQGVIERDSTAGALA
jgi:LacI family transcriptional regulator